MSKVVGVCECACVCDIIGVVFLHIEWGFHVPGFATIALHHIRSDMEVEPVQVFGVDWCIRISRQDRAYQLCLQDSTFILVSSQVHIRTHTHTSLVLNFFLRRICIAIEISNVVAPNNMRHTGKCQGKARIEDWPSGLHLRLWNIYSNVSYMTDTSVELCGVKLRKSTR